MKHLFRIGEISKLLNIPVSTLRYYDETGLLAPSFTDASNGYRYYSVEQLEQLNTIRYLKALDIPLQEIKMCIEARNIDNILSILKKQQQQTHAKIAELERINQKIENRIIQINDALNKRNQLGIIQEKIIPSRKSVALKKTIYAGDNIEIPIRKLENRVNLENSIFLGKVGLSISKEKLYEKKFREYDSIFLLLEGEKVQSDMVKNLPHGTYVTICFQGGHEEASPYYRKLLHYIQKQKIKILDDSLEITLIDRGLTTDVDKFVTEIQILVNKP